uniref:NADH dehydrogenase subunit 2 n=1 Tax=Stroggylocephalus agrestis TaxID=3112133 RepID=UPI002E765EC1|nr:NADH dehydrogenase subunit 2 [Stroggylocephalus agrestis]WRK21271.1 NADH dehydrogenase subunit 2 [Stroggylocephalus agrestis]
MKMNSTTFLFLNTMMLGVMVSASANNWIMIWSGMEISMMSFVPLIMNKSVLSNESSMKYFIMQSISSSIMMLGVMMVMMSLEVLFKTVLITSLLVKTGMFPFQNWVMIMIEGMSYESSFIFLSMLKIAPLIIMGYLDMKLEFISLLNLMMGAILSLNQTSMRKIMAYSSVFNMGFMISSIKFFNIWFLYFLIYSLMLMLIFIQLKKFNINFINHIIMSEYMMTSKIQLWINVLSMGGMPPMLGFLSKMIVIQLMMELNKFILTLIMIISSLIMMFIYLRFTFLSLMIFSSSMKWFKLSSKMSMFPMIINLFSTMMLLLTKPLS